MSSQSNSWDLPRESNLSIDPNLSSILESTPRANSHITPQTTSRKRKHHHDSLSLSAAAYKPYTLSRHEGTTFDYNSFPSSPIVDFEREIFSSTLNESVAQKFEKCSLKFYTETSGTSEKEPTSVSYDNPPVTPIKNVVTGDNLSTKSQVKFTPSKVGFGTKLGSPERNEILYGSLPQHEKQVSPLKFCSSASFKRNSPAKKRLFSAAIRKPNRKSLPARLDPVEFLETMDVISVIFRFLTDVDLFNCTYVSKRWRGAVISDRKAMVRYRCLQEQRRTNKENVKSLQRFSGPCQVEFKVMSPIKPVSPGKKNFRLYTEAARLLTSDQSLAKCHRCQDLSIVTDGISYCQRLHCGYISCRHCLSFSTTGPRQFVDRCRQSSLRPDNHLRLDGSSCWDSGMEEGDGEGGGGGGVPSFLSQVDSDGVWGEKSHNSRDESSGYGTTEEWEGSGTGSYSWGNSTGSFHRSSLPGALTTRNVLQESNHSSSSSSSSTRLSEGRLDRRNSTQLRLVTMPAGQLRASVEVMEPSSPPKVKDVAFSQKSKRNLKRLLR